MAIRFDDQVVIVTGSGNGLGRSHALAFAARGAKVVVNDLGGARDGTGASSAAAKEVVELIRSQGGEAIANGANVTDYEQVQQMVADAVDKWGRVDVLVNNAGILRDKSFVKGSLEDFKLVLDVHLMGSVNCSKAVWEIMRQQSYGRIVMTTSSSGLYGNFGQTNYGSAKMAVLGLMNTLVLEGHKYGIHVNALAPTAGTRMLEDLIADKKIMQIMSVEAVTAGLLTLCDKDAPNRSILCAGAGGYSTVHIYENEGIYLPPEKQTAENVRANVDKINDPQGQHQFTMGSQQTNRFVGKALKHFGIDAAAVM